MMAKQIQDGISALLDDEIETSEFDSALEAMRRQPALLESFREQQYVRDALRGNPCPDRHYSQRIMEYIARHEGKSQ
jgi:negative regulator of sigma E activity